MCLYAEVFEQQGVLSRLEAFASHYGADFYGLPRNTRKLRLEQRPWVVPDSYEFGSSTVTPLCAGQELQWRVIADGENSTEGDGIC